jgi:transposase-like protein
MGKPLCKSDNDKKELKKSAANKFRCEKCGLKADKADKLCKVKKK